MARKNEPQQRTSAAGRKPIKAPARKCRATTASKLNEEDWWKEFPHQTDPILFPPEMDSMTREAIKTFVKELPSLLEQYTPDHWVAYRGREVVGVSESIEELYAKVRALGIPDEEMYYHTPSPIVTRAWV
jgi:hypothetical protein